MKEDIKADTHGDERAALMEPLVIAAESRHGGGLTDLAFDLAQKSAAFHAGLPAGLPDSLANLARAKSLTGKGVDTASYRTKSPSNRPSKGRPN